MNNITDKELPDLDDYMEYPETDNCYLDGRYFDLVFQNFSGYINSPMYINKISTKNLLKQLYPHQLMA